jgi:hypothetical protein
MQRGDEGQAAASRAIPEHLAREKRAHGVRDCVVHVQKVEIVQLGDLSHAGGQRQIVGRIIEERITRYFDFVIMNVRFLAAQPDGLGIGDEMNLVAALGQLQTEFRGYHAAAAVGGITGDANLHCVEVRPFQWPRLCDSMALRDRRCRFYRASVRLCGKAAWTAEFTRMFLARVWKGLGRVYPNGLVGDV